MSLPSADDSGGRRSVSSPVPPSPLRRQSIAVAKVADGWLVWFARVLKLSSGRDKVCACCQYGAKFYAVVFCDSNESHAVWRGVGEDLSQGRKIFRILKWVPETKKLRNAVRSCAMNWALYVEDIHRSLAQPRLRELPPTLVGDSTTGRLVVGSGGGAAAEVSGGDDAERAKRRQGYWFAALVSGLEATAHLMAINYFMLDNFVWATGLGIFRSKEVPKNLKGIWQGARRNEGMVLALGGMSGVKRKRNYFSFFRNMIAILSHALFLSQSAVLPQHGVAARNIRLIEFTRVLLTTRILLHKLDLMTGAGAAWTSAYGFAAAILGVYVKGLPDRRR